MGIELWLRNSNPMLATIRPRTHYGFCTWTSGAHLPCSAWSADWVNLIFVFNFKSSIFKKLTMGITWYLVQDNKNYSNHFLEHVSFWRNLTGERLFYEKKPQINLYQEARKLVIFVFFISLFRERLQKLSIWVSGFGLLKIKTLSHPLSPLTDQSHKKKCKFIFLFSRKST